MPHIVSIHLYSASCRAHQSEELPVREIQREERGFTGNYITCLFAVTLRAPLMQISKCNAIQYVFSIAKTVHSFWNTPAVIECGGYYGKQNLIRSELESFVEDAKYHLHETQTHQHGIGEVVLNWPVNVYIYGRTSIKKNERTTSLAGLNFLSTSASNANHFTGRFSLSPRQ